MTKVSITPAVQQFLQRRHGSFIAGRAVHDESGAAIEVINPATGEALAAFTGASAAQVEEAVVSARAAFEDSWAQTSPYQRGVLLNRLADLIEQHGEELAQLESLCSGKAINLARGLEVAQSAVFLRYFAGWATKINGETMTPSLPSMAGEQYMAFTRREAIGVVAGIVPWNFPIMIGIWKIASALTTGCTVVVKPSEFTPLTLLRVAELAIEAGIPAGVINVVNGLGSVGQQLIGHPRISKVSFPGSVPTGIAVGKAAMEAKLTRATLELGGKNPAAMLADVDIHSAVQGIVMAAFSHQGQICASPERLYVHRSIADDFAKALGQALQTLKIGSPMDESVHFGPLANKPHYDKMLAFFARAQASNTVICGAKAHGDTGYFVEPTVILANGTDDPFLHEETFGPIVCILPFDDEQHLVDLMNDSPYGLGASIWTNNLSKALSLIPKLEFGTVWVNMHTFLDPAVPFGGTKASGLGREFGSAFIEDYTELKSVMIRY